MLRSHRSPASPPIHRGKLFRSSRALPLYLGVIVSALLLFVCYSWLLSSDAPPSTPQFPQHAVPALDVPSGLKVVLDHSDPTKSLQVNACTSRQLVIGIGTGRCGTLSFAEYLDKQPDSRMYHEKWNCDDYRWYVEEPVQSVDEYHEIRRQLARKRIDKLEKSTDTRVRGDVALWHLPYIPYILEYRPYTKIVWLQRKKEDTVRSFVKWFGFVHQGHFPWITAEERRHTSYHDSPTWDFCYPRFEMAYEPGMSPSILETASEYVDLYYREANKLAQTYPRNFRIYNTYELTASKELQSDLLDFVGICANRSLEYPQAHDTGKYGVNVEELDRRFAENNVKGWNGL